MLTHDRGVDEAESAAALQQGVGLGGAAVVRQDVEVGVTGQQRGAGIILNQVSDVGGDDAIVHTVPTAGDPFAAVNDVINYSFVVENTGNLRLIGPVTIDDNLTSDEACPNVNTGGNNDSFLDPGEQIICTATYTVDQNDVNAGSVTNIADATADGTTSPTDTRTATYIQIFADGFETGDTRQ